MVSNFPKPFGRRRHGREYSDTFSREQNLVLTRGLLALFVSAIGLMFLSTLFAELYDLPSLGPDALVFAAQVNVIPALWLIVGIRTVSRFRYFSRKDIKGAVYAPPSRSVAVRLAFLQNTLEQSVLLALCNFVVVTLRSEQATAYALASVLIFTAGRMIFWISYSGGAASRAFGMVMTMAPAIGGVSWFIADMVAYVLNVSV